jgi:hypothetical protein
MLNSSVAGEIDHELSTDKSIKTFCRCNFGIQVGIRYPSGLSFHI